MTTTFNWTISQLDCKPQIDAQINPPVITPPLPWAQVSQPAA